MIGRILCFLGFHSCRKYSIMNGRGTLRIYRRCRWERVEFTS